MIEGVGRSGAVGTTEDKLESPRISCLVAFICVDKFGGYSKAATYLGLKQSTVSRQIKSLERWLGAKILTNNKPPRLTPYGSMFLRNARNIVKICIYREEGCDIYQRHLIPHRMKSISQGRLGRRQWRSDLLAIGEYSE
jgi:hypothetical protein